MELALTGRAQTVTVMYLGEISTEFQKRTLPTDPKGGTPPGTALVITPGECAEGMMRAMDRRLHSAWVPLFMHPLSLLGSLVAWRPRFFEQGFLKQRPAMQVWFTTPCTEPPRVCTMSINLKTHLTLNPKP